MDVRDLEEFFAPAGRVEARRMFGGVGVFADGLMVALQAGGVVYLKVDGESEPAFLAEGLEPFSYVAKGVTKSLGYRRLPDAAYDDPDAMRIWFGLALSAARRKAAARPARKPKRRSARDI
ncbi:TfoX/Sxy family protein [Alsobacter sp. KACC 23698]|uniref:TfoX/Sxy family protein n=1 Tax=Alsobacter sp. KACC 23698 TaxID=3149229 RepID=A0AAU7J956_9HYPH